MAQFNSPQRIWRRTGLVLGALVLLGIFFRLWSQLVSPLVENFFHPYLEFTRRGTALLSDRTLLLRSHSDLAAEVEKLRKFNRQLTLQAGTANELWAENSELRKLLKLQPPRRWSFCAAEVTLRDPAQWNGRFILNKGRLHNVVSGAAVAEIGDEGTRLLSGIVGEVYDHCCEVIPVGNPALRLAVRLGDHGEIGFLNAGERRPEPGRIPVGFLPPDFSAPPGTAVMTAGFEEQIPPGLKVGELANLDPPEGLFSTQLSISGSLEPASRPNRLRYLFIVLKEPIEP